MARKEHTLVSFTSVVRTPQDVARLERSVLPTLLRVKAAIHKATGFEWDITSWIRESPSHKTGFALDIAPYIDPGSEQHYAFFQGSDPILSRRIPLLAKLRDALTYFNNTTFGKQVKSQFRIGIFVETDHVHIGVFAPDGMPNEVYAWPVPKSYYSDTNARNSLPSLPNARLIGASRNKRSK